MNPIILYDNIIPKAVKFTAYSKNIYGYRNIFDYRPYTYWEASSHALIVRFRQNMQIDTIGISKHNLFSHGAKVKVGYIDIYTPKVVKEFMPQNDGNILIKLESELSSREFSLYFFDAENKPVKPTIGVVFFGKRMEFPYTPDAPFISLNESIMSETLVSKSGRLLGVNHRFNPINVSHRFSNLERSWIENEYRPFWNNHGKFLKPFFYAPDLDNLPNDVYYCRFSEESLYATQLSNLNYADSLQLNLVGSK